MRAWYLIVAFVACANSKDPPANHADHAPITTSTPDRKCLPVVAKECGCVYSCGTGILAGDHWTVTHSSWKATTLSAKVERWCVGAACTDAFVAQIVCDGICQPKPADPTCHFDPSGACVGSGG